MADFKARPPSTFNPVNSDFRSFADWRQDFTTFVPATSMTLYQQAIQCSRRRLFEICTSKPGHQRKHDIYGNS